MMQEHMGRHFCKSSLVSEMFFHSLNRFMRFAIVLLL